MKWVKKNNIDLKDLIPRNVPTPSKVYPKTQKVRDKAQKVRDAIKKEYLRLFITSSLSCEQICEVVAEKYGVKPRAIPMMLPKLEVAALPKPNKEYCKLKKAKTSTK